MTPIYIYSISRGYRKVTAWQGSRMTHSRIGVFTCRPNTGLSREERHRAISAWLFKYFKISGPAYREKDVR